MRVIIYRFYGEKKLEPADLIIYQKDGTKHSLTLKTVQLQQAGTYTVKATNPTGSQSASAKLKVKKLAGKYKLC